MNGRNLLILVFVAILVVWVSSAAFASVAPPIVAFTGGGGPGSLVLLMILMILAIPLVAIIGGLFIQALKVLRGDGSESGGPGDFPEDEGQTIQEIHRGLNRMERRVEALETILLEKTSRRSREESFRTEEKNDV